MARTRKNVWKLLAGDQTLYWYGRAVKEMGDKQIAEPTSWRYQAAIHQYDRGRDPHKDPSDVLPSTADQGKFWTQCQHGSWYFLPWHRMYLHHFEQIVLSHVKAMNGPSDWALPYWNYSESTASALLPTDFRNENLPNGNANPLYVADRNPDANMGNQFADPVETAIAYCLKRTKFTSGLTGGSAGFGGPITVFHHSGGTAGSTEATPHGTMHGAVGGTGGWMSGFTTAPLDPIFWLHHCNIDRLWDVWLKRLPTHLNPTTANWLTSVSFPFNTASGGVVSMTPSQVLDTQAAPLDYVYDDTSDPIAVAGPTAAVGAKRLVAGATTLQEQAMESGPQGAAAGQPPPVPEMVAATSAPFRLQPVPTKQQLDVQAPRGPARLAAAGIPGAAAQRVFLNIEQITSEQRSVPYDVYLNLPDGADPKQHPELRAGRLPMFGLVEATSANRNHPDNGLHYTLEVTELYKHLSQEPGWDATKVRVAFIPARADGPAQAQVGRVSLYFA